MHGKKKMKIRFIRLIRLILNVLKKMQSLENHKIQIKTPLAECITDDWYAMNTKIAYALINS